MSILKILPHMFKNRKKPQNRIFLKVPHRASENRKMRLKPQEWPPCIKVTLCSKLVTCCWTVHICLNKMANTHLHMTQNGKLLLWRRMVLIANIGVSEIIRFVISRAICPYTVSYHARQHYSLPTLQFANQAENLQSTNFTVCQPYSLPTLQFSNPTVCQLYSFPTLQSANSTVCQL